MYRFFLLLLLFSSCGTSEPLIHSELQTEKSDVEVVKDNAVDVYNIQFTARQYHPYCGGAAPSEDQMNQYSQLYGGFLLIDLQTNEKSALSANNEGVFRLMLAPGKYVIKEAFKDIPFNQFMQQHKKEGMYMMPGTDECYEKWWSANLADFEIIKGGQLQTFNFQLASSCFTGNNPCAIYMGPIPP